MGGGSEFVRVEGEAASKGNAADTCSPEPCLAEDMTDIDERQISWDQQDSQEDQGSSGEQITEFTGPFETLAGSGPRDSAGSIGHPEECTPCTFYCFARRGCNRGAECRFCHLAHQSKLQLRREAWKQQQRQKRKAMNEAMAAEAAARRREASARPQALDFKRGMAADGTVAAGYSAGSCTAAARATPIALFDRLVETEQERSRRALGEAQSMQKMAARHPDALAARPNFAGGSFAYSPARAILGLGQKMDFRPQLTDLGGVPAQFRPVSPLPPGMTLDPATGVLYAAPTQALRPMTVLVEAEMLGGRALRGSVELEVIDFSRGGFHIGHLSEFEPGRFMVLLCKPDDAEDEVGLPITQGLERQTSKGGRLPSLPEEVPDNLAQRPQRHAWANATDEEANDDEEEATSTVLRLAKALDDPLLGTAALPSVGSVGHHENKCSPCAFVYKEGCQSGAACRFCHLCERGEKRRRKKELKGFQRSMMT